MNRNLLFLTAALLFMLSCSKDSDNEPTDDEPIVMTDDDPVGQPELYFPPLVGSNWETYTPEELDFDISQEQGLQDYLDEKNTDAFMILKDGKIVVEWYFGDFTSDDNHTWNSAGKTLTAMTVGIAQDEGLLDIGTSSKTYLGDGWSSMTAAQEDAITVWNHLTMTTGLDYNRSGTFSDNDFFCTDIECLTYLNEPNSYWYYHNAPYTILDEVITNASGTDFKDYFYEKVRDRIGMQGLWISVGYNNLYFSTARSMARFGLLVLNEGTWEETPILTDKDYFEAMTTTSQDNNLSYGYLWWLNGKTSFRIPGSEETYSGEIIPNAPDDMISALGANDQKLYIIPSEKLVVIRFGDDASGGNFASSSFDNELWGKLNSYIK